MNMVDDDDQIFCLSCKKYVTTCAHMAASVNNIKKKIKKIVTRSVVKDESSGQIIEVCDSNEDDGKQNENIFDKLFEVG